MLSVNEFFSTHSSKSLMPLPINALDKNLTPKKLITPWSESRAGKLTPQKFASHSLVTHTITQLQKIVYSKYSPEQSSQILEKPQTTVEIKTAITNQASDTDRLQILANQLRIHSLNHTEQNRSYPELPAFQVLRASEDSKTLGERQSFDSYEHAQMRHFISSQPQITREQIKQKEYEPNPSPLKTEEKPAVTDLNSVAEKVYQLIERKARIERERRG
jgi:hypothetical protein